MLPQVLPEASPGASPSHILSNYIPLRPAENFNIKVIGSSQG
jgi:hypothetical protein